MGKRGARDNRPTPPGGGADLHLHTTLSDGSRTPEQLVAAALQAGLGAIAVTDHDTLAGVAPAVAAAAGTKLEVVRGVELSAQAGLQEIHVLGLFLPAEPAALAAELQLYRERRRARIYVICERLRAMGLDVRAEEVFAFAANEAPGRAHVARVLCNRGLVSAMGEAFDRYLGNDAPGYVPKERPAAADAVRLIHRAGGAAVMAHPGLTRRDDVIPGLVAAGLDGIEVYAPAHGPELVAHYTELARQHGLLASAGSDSHGDNKETCPLGCVRLGAEDLELLRARAADRASRT